MFASDNSHLCRKVDVVSINTMNGARNCHVHLYVKDVVLDQVLTFLKTLGAIKVSLHSETGSEWMKVTCNVDNYVIARTIKSIFARDYDPVSDSVNV